jgi:phospholipase D-like protein
MLKIFLLALPIVLAVYALVDLVQTKDEDVQGLPKLVWVLLIVLVWVVGPLAWLLAGSRSRTLPGLRPRAGGLPAPGRHTTAPDDDPDFLRGLNPPRPPEDDEPGPPVR